MTRCMLCEKEIPYAKYVMASGYKWHIDCYENKKKIIDSNKFDAEKFKNWVFKFRNRVNIKTFRIA